MANKVEIKFIGKGDLLTQIKKLDKATKSLINAQAKLVNQGKKTKTDSEKNAVAIEKLATKLVALGFDYKKVLANNKHFVGALKGSRIELEKLKISTNKYIKSQNKANVSTRILGGSFAVLRSRLLLFNFAMALGVRQLLLFAKEASKVESMERAFNTLAGGGESATKALSKLKEATNNTMSSFDLFQQANNAMILGVSKNSDEMAEMFDIAQRLGNALGRDTAQSVESLVTGIGRQSRLMLDNIGIVVKSEEAYEDYAKTLNKNANELTDLEKKQAFNNATMKQARLLTKLLAPEVENGQMAFDSFGASISDMSVDIGKALVPMLVVLADLTKSFANAVDVDDFKKLRDGIISLAIAYGTYQTAVVLATISTKSLNFAMLKNPVGLLIAGFTTLTFSVLQYKKAEELTAEQVRDRLIQKEKLLFKANALRAEIRQLITAEINNGDVIEKNNKLRDAQIEKVNSITKSLGNELIQLKLRRAGIEGVSEAQLKLLEFDAKYGKDRKGLTDVQKSLLDSIIAEIAHIEKLKKLKQDLLEEEKKLQNLKKENNDDENKRIQLNINKIKKAEQAKKTIFADTASAQLLELDKLEGTFLSFNEHNLESEKFFADARNEIFQEEAMKRIENEIRVSSQLLSSFSSLTSAYEDNVQMRKQNELNSLKATSKFQNATNEERANMEHELNKKFAKEERRVFGMKKLSALSEIAINTAVSMTKHLGNIPLMAFIGAMGAIQAGIVASQQPPTYESGGLLGGKSHSQGGTIIEAERGEFVVNKRSVNALGLPFMNAINSYANGGFIGQVQNEA